MSFGHEPHPSAARHRGRSALSPLEGFPQGEGRVIMLLAALKQVTRYSTDTLELATN